MDLVVVSPLNRAESSVTRYELPPEGITNLGYIVRRMHKTSTLGKMSETLQGGEFVHALYTIALYAAAAASSFGKLYYEPGADEEGGTITENDPETGAVVSATLIKREDDLNYYSHMVQMPDGDRFSGNESSRPSKMSMRGWVFPASVSYQFMSADEAYYAECEGELTREVVPRVIGPWHSRAHGTLTISDNQGNSGHITLNEKAQATVTITCPCSRTVLHRQVSLI